MASLAHQRVMSRRVSRTMSDRVTVPGPSPNPREIQRAKTAEDSPDPSPAPAPRPLDGVFTGKRASRGRLGGAAAAPPSVLVSATPASPGFKAEHGPVITFIIISSSSSSSTSSSSSSSMFVMIVVIVILILMICIIVISIISVCTYVHTYIYIYIYVYSLKGFPLCSLWPHVTRQCGSAILVIRSSRRRVNSQVQESQRLSRRVAAVRIAWPGARWGRPPRCSGPSP